MVPCLPALPICKISGTCTCTIPGNLMGERSFCYCYLRIAIISNCHHISISSTCMQCYTYLSLSGSLPEKIGDLTTLNNFYLQNTRYFGISVGNSHFTIDFLISLYYLPFSYHCPDCREQYQQVLKN